VPALEPVPEAAEVTGAAAGVEPEPELAPVPEPVAAEVTDAAAEVTGAVADVVPEPEPVPVAAEVTGAAAGVEPGPELAPVPELEPVAVDTAEVTGAVADVVLEPDLARLAEGLVAACACREKTSKTTRIPAAAIATCIARRAMSRMIGCGISSSPLPGQTRLSVPLVSDPKHASEPFFGSFFSEITRKRTLRSARECTY
jgi:hypothetical protein